MGGSAYVVGVRPAAVWAMWAVATVTTGSPWQTTTISAGNEVVPGAMPIPGHSSMCASLPCTNHASGDLKPSSADDRYSATSSADDRYSGISSADDRYSGTSSADDRYSGTSSADDRYSGTSSADDRYSATSSADDRYSGTAKPRIYGDDSGTLGAEMETMLCVPDQDLSSFTVCALVKMHTRNRRTPLLTYTGRVNIVIEASRRGVALLVQAQDRQAFHSFFHVKMPPEVWRHLCLQYQYNTSQVRCFVDGEEIVSATRSLDRTAEDTTSLNDGEGIGMNEEIDMGGIVGQPRRPVAEEAQEVGMVCVGGHGQQGGLVAEVTFWRRILGIEMLHTISGCHQHDHLDQPDLEMTPQWFVVGNASLRSNKRHNVCVSEPRAVVVQPAGTYARHTAVCHALGGVLVPHLTSAAMAAARGLNDTCLNTEGLITWLKGGHRVSEAAGKMNSEECPAMSVDGRKWASCELQMECSVCEVSASVMYTLYGHDGSLFDHTYYIPTHSRTLVFRGLGGSEIRQKNNGWLLRSTMHNTEWLLGKLEVPIGRHNWSTGDHEVVLALTICRTTQFACDDGQCVPQTSRCDDIVHCLDSSDEADCQVVERPPGYDPDYPPPPRPGDVLPTNLGYHIDVYDVGDVTTEEGVASMDLAITIPWFDPRLKFLNLKPKIKNYFPCERVWTPRVRAVSGRGHGTILTSNNYEKFCYVYSNDQTELRPLHDPLMSQQSQGVTTAIEMYLGMLLKVPCRLQLQMYPFDVQLCNLSFVVVNTPWRSVFHKSSPGRHVPYLNSRRVLLEYSLEDLTTEVSWALQGADNNTNCGLTLHLRRLYAYHLTNSFFPSLLIFFISYATFFFQLQDFTNRIMVALTAQLVLAELFSSTTSSSVKTPYLKLIDVWYAAVITFCFLIVISQTAINVILHRVRLPGIIIRVKELDCRQQSKVSPLLTLRAGARNRRKHKDLRHVPRSCLEMARRSNSVARVSVLTVAALFVFFYMLMAAGILRVFGISQGDGPHSPRQEQLLLAH